MIIVVIALVFGFLLGFGSGIWLKRNNDDSALVHQRNLEIIRAQQEKEVFLLTQKHKNDLEYLDRCKF